MTFSPNPATKVYPLLCLTVLFYLLLSCEDDITFPNDPPVEDIAVTCVLRNHQPLLVSLSRIALPIASVNFRVRDATVQLYRNDTLLVTLTDQSTQVCQPDDPRQGSFYVGQEDMELVDGASYYLSVVVPGLEPILSEAVRYDKVIGEVDYTVSRGVSDQEVVENYAYTVLRERQSGRIIRQILFIQDTTNVNFELDRTNKTPFLAPGFELVLNAGATPGRYERAQSTLTFRGGIEAFPTQCYNIVYQPRHYLDFAEPYTSQQTETLVGRYRNGVPLPSNMSNGFGYFSIIDVGQDCNN